MEGDMGEWTPSRLGAAWGIQILGSPSKAEMAETPAVKRSAWDALRGWMSPSKKPHKSPPMEAPKRLDLPVLKHHAKGKKKQDKFLLALASAKALRGRNFKNPSIEKDFCAASSLGSKNAKKRTVAKILESFNSPGPPLPLTADTLKGLASALSDGGYKAGEGYVVEAKLWHVEEGHAWSDLLDRVFKQCKRALARGQGPRKKAAEVPLEARHKPNKLNFSKTEKAVKFGKELFVFSVVWMLREIELAALCTNDLTIDHTSKRVSLYLKMSKMDASGKGVTRTLQCLCVGNDCSKECPYGVTTDLVCAVEKFNGTGSPLMLMKDKQAATKAQIIKTWRWLFGQEVSGHSGRRSGALSYIRAGWSISQVAHLGRWKSSAILQYAEEALEQMPANLHLPNTTVGDTGVIETKLHQVSEEELKLWKKQLREEIKLLREDMDKKEADQEVMLDYWAKFYKENPGTLPKKVQSSTSKVIHINLSKSAASPPLTWKTACGWGYYGSNFVFQDAEAVVTCQKCLGLCARTQ